MAYLTLFCATFLRHSVVRRQMKKSSTVLVQIISSNSPANKHYAILFTWTPSWIISLSYGIQYANKFSQKSLWIIAWIYCQRSLASLMAGKRASRDRLECVRKHLPLSAGCPRCYYNFSCTLFRHFNLGEKLYASFIENNLMIYN